MRYTFCIVLFVSSFPSFVVAKSSYHSELNTNYSKLEIKDRSASIIDVKYVDKSIEYKYYFNSVYTKSHPLREAAFLGKTSSVSSKLTQSKVEFGGFDYTIDIYGLQYEHITRNSSLPISFSIGYAEEDYSSDIMGISFLDGKEKMLGIGAYVRDNTKIAFNYVRTEFSDVRFKVYDLNIRSVMKTGAGSSFTIYASVDQRDFTGDDKFEIYTFNPTYYVNQRIGIGTIFRADSDGEGREYVLNAEIFFTSKFAAKLEIRKISDRNDPNYKADGLQVSFTGRF